TRGPDAALWEPPEVNWHAARTRDAPAAARYEEWIVFMLVAPRVIKRKAVRKSTIMPLNVNCAERASPTIRSIFAARSWLERHLFAPCSVGARRTSRVPMAVSP